MSILWVTEELFLLKNILHIFLLKINRKLLRAVIRKRKEFYEI